MRFKHRQLLMEYNSLRDKLFTADGLKTDEYNSDDYRKYQECWMKLRNYGVNPLRARSAKLLVFKIIGVVLSYTIPALIVFLVYCAGYDAGRDSIRESYIKSVSKLVAHVCNYAQVEPKTCTDAIKSFGLEVKEPVKKEEGHEV